MRPSTKSFALSATLFLSAVVFAQSSVISPIAADRNGLKRSWMSQISLDGPLDELAFIRPHVSSTAAQAIHDVMFEEARFRFPVGADGALAARRASNVKYVELRLAGLNPRAYPVRATGKDGGQGGAAYELVCHAGKFRVSELDRDAFGKPLDVAGAKKKSAEILKKLIKVGVKAKIKTHVVPRVSLLLATKRGRVQVLDAETGRTIWKTTIGDPEHIVFGPSASDEYVAVISGITVYLLNMSDGQVKWTRKMAAIPGAGPNISDDYVYVPMLRGRVESIPIANHRYESRVYMSPGRVRVRPTFTPRSLVWPTEGGKVYVANANRKGMRYRLESGGGIHSEISYIAPDKFVSTSLDGIVYCLQEQSGEITWRFSTGGRLRQSAVLVGDSAYAVTTDGSMHCLALADGVQRWTRPYIKSVIAVSKDRLYCVDGGSRIVVLGAKTGAQLGSLPMSGVDMWVSNDQTDRIYVATKRGFIQCLHEEAQEFPVPHAGMPELKSAKKKVDPDAKNKARKKAAAKKQPAGGGGKANPFGPAGGGAGGGNNPFGGAGGGAPKKAGNNPFGGAGGGAPKKAGNNPFGGAGAPKKKAGNNPFN